MARPKKNKKKEVEEVEIVEQTLVVIPTPIDKIAVDYPSEGLNNMANKINEIIDVINALQK